jgi:hypothetical protein
MNLYEVRRIKEIFRECLSGYAVLVKFYEVSHFIKLHKWRKNDVNTKYDEDC